MGGWGGGVMWILTGTIRTFYRCARVNGVTYIFATVRHTQLGNYCMHSNYSYYGPFGVVDPNSLNQDPVQHFLIIPN